MRNCRRKMPCSLWEVKVNRHRRITTLIASFCVMLVIFNIFNAIVTSHREKETSDEERTDDGKTPIVPKSRETVVLEAPNRNKMSVLRENTRKIQTMRRKLRRQQNRTPAGALKTFTILYYNKFYDNDDFYVGFGSEPFKKCRYRNCQTTKDKSLLQKADVVVFHMLNGIPEPNIRLGHQRYAFFLKEPPTLSWFDMTKYNDFFNLTMTYRSDSDVVNDYFQLYNEPETPVLPPLEKKRRPIAWIVSNCESQSGRELYVDLLQEHINVDIYGKCGPYTCPEGGRQTCYQHLAPHYYFYLSFENSRCKDYVTEKFSYPLHYGMVPIVLGPNRTTYEQLGPPNAFIHIDDFAGPKELAQYLRYLMANTTAYRQYFAWRNHYRVESESEIVGWCSLCNYLNQSPPAKWYSDIGKWWTQDQCNLELVVPEPEDDAEYEPAQSPAGG